MPCLCSLYSSSRGCNAKNQLTLLSTTIPVQACEHLDSAAGAGNSHGYWQAPAAAGDPDAAGVPKVASAPVDLEEAPQLEEVLHYLRAQYWYCLYCGTRYEDSADLEANCPGPSEADHADG